MKINNPASRLFDILTAATKISYDVSCQKAWASIFQCAPTDSPKIYRLLSNTMLLPSEVAILVRTHFPRQISSISLWQDPIEKAFQKQNLQNSWQTFRQHLDVHCISTVGMISDLLHGKINETEVDLDKLHELSNNLNKLRLEIIESDIHKDVKLYIIRELAKLIQIISEYSISGAEPILQQIDTMFGHVVRNKEYRSFLKDNEKGQRILENLSAAANILTVAIGLPQLTMTINNLIT